MFKKSKKARITTDKDYYLLGEEIKIESNLISIS